MRAARALQRAMERRLGLPAQDKLVRDAARPIPASPTRRWSTRATPARRAGKAPRRSPPAISGRCRATPRSVRPARSPTCSADAATVWTASQGTHGNRNTFARFLGLPRGEGAADLSRRLRLLRHERPRGRRRRRRDPVARGRASGARAMVARGRAWLGPEGPAAAARHFRRRRRRRPHPRLAHRDVDSADDQRAAQHSAARRRRPPASTSRRASIPA